jgi:hypothetical protein
VREDASFNGMDNSSDAELDSLEEISDGQSDSPEEPEHEPLPPDHPFLLFRRVALSIIQSACATWRQHVEAQGQGQNQASGGQTAAPGRAEAPKKRSRGHNHRGQDGDDADEGSSQPDPGARDKRRRLEEEHTRTLACPFFKKDSLKHMRCCGFTLSRTRDVKQHLYRIHQMPLYCATCFVTFRDENKRDSHVRARDCIETPGRSKPDGITESQRRWLAKKASSNLSEEEQWFGIFEHLFPDVRRPESAYIVTGMMQDVTAYQLFMNTQGTQIIRDVLTAGGRVTWNLPNTETDLWAFQHRILTDAIEGVFQRWMGYGGLPPTSAAGDSSALATIPDQIEDQASLQPSSMYTHATQLDQHQPMPSVMSPAGASSHSGAFPDDIDHSSDANSNYGFVSHDGSSVVSLSGDLVDGDNRFGGLNIDEQSPWDYLSAAPAAEQAMVDNIFESRLGLDLHPQTIARLPMRPPHNGPPRSSDGPGQTQGSLSHQYSSDRAPHANFSGQGGPTTSYDSMGPAQEYNPGQAGSAAQYVADPGRAIHFSGNTMQGGSSSYRPHQG